MRRTVAVALTAALLCCEPFQVTTRSWEAFGHALVAKLAWLNMTTEARSTALNLLDGQRLEDAAEWADRILVDRPDTENWHTVRIPPFASRYQASRDCKLSRRGDCIVQALGRTRAQIAKPELDKATRKDALRFLIHLLADLHQPLNCIDGGNRANSGFKVLVWDHPDYPYRSTILAVWEVGLLARRRRAVPDYDGHLARTIQRKAAHPEATDFVRWAEESHSIAQRAFQPADDARAIGELPVIELSDEYLEWATAAAEAQIQRAALRLSQILNETLGRTPVRGG